MRTLCLLAIALLLGSSAFCQPTNQVHLLTPQAAKIADSLRALPLARQEAAAWRQASRFYQLAADSLRYANARNLDAVRASQRAFDAQRMLTASEAAQAEDWKRKARRRGLLNYLGLAVASGAAYLFITH